MGMRVQMGMTTKIRKLDILNFLAIRVFIDLKMSLSGVPDLWQWILQILNAALQQCDKVDGSHVFKYKKSNLYWNRNIIDGFVKEGRQETFVLRWTRGSCLGGWVDCAWRTILHSWMTFCYLISLLLMLWRSWQGRVAWEVKRRLKGTRLKSRWTL